MKTLARTLEVITPCLSGGAHPQKQAEIRAPSIRGQLRWWFRSLGGFKSMLPRPVDAQEKAVFGHASAPDSQASPLVVRVWIEPPRSLGCHTARDAEGLRAPAGSDRDYLLFPLHNSARAVFDPPPFPRFNLELQWRGESGLGDDIEALLAVFGHWGSLGFRSRRALGALAFAHDPPPLAAALPRFARPDRILVKKMRAHDPNHAVTVLAQWLKKWRAYGRTAGNQLNRFKPGFAFAKNDHDAGRNRRLNPTYRPALGLPIVQRFSGGGHPVRWEYGAGQPNHPRGRFASPVLLRPYRDAQQQWLALVLFVDHHQWPDGHKVVVDGQPRTVSLDLYEAMKKDPALLAFP